MPTSNNRNLTWFRRGKTDPLRKINQDGLKATDKGNDPISYGEPVFDVDKGYLSIGVRKRRHNTN